MAKLKTYLKLFLIMFKIGLFTFGGGYAMISIIENEFVEKQKWIEREDFLNIVGIAESTPGPLAINSSTYIGYKIGGVLGSVFATLGVVLPSFIIIFCISLFFDRFLQLTFVQYAFKGIQVCVAFLILSAGIKMFKHLKRNIFNYLLFFITTILLICFSIFAINFSSIFLILGGGFIGVVFYLTKQFIYKFKDKREDKNLTIEENQSKEDREGK